jgi:hypothetical protein
MCLTRQSKRSYKAELQEWAQIRHFVPHPQQSKGLWKAGLHIWITNSALRALSGNQEMAIEREEGVPAPEQYHVTIAQY